MFEKNDSFFIVKNIALKCIPYNICIKQRIEGDTLVVTTKDLSLYFLNNILKDFIELCDGKKTIQNIIDILHKYYDVEYEVLELDIINSIRDLQKKRIIYLEDIEWI